MRKILMFTVLTATILALGAPVAQAFEETRPLADRLADPTPEAPVLDTALVFTNVGGRASHAKFTAYDEFGAELSSGEIEIPAGGLVYVLASRIANAAEVDGFVGHVKAKATGRVHGRTIVVGVLGTDVDTINQTKRRRPSADASGIASDEPLLTSHIIFPVVATR